MHNTFEQDPVVINRSGFLLKVVVVGDRPFTLHHVEESLRNKWGAKFFYYKSINECIGQIRSNEHFGPFCLMMNFEEDFKGKSSLLLDLLNERKLNFFTIAVGAKEILDKMIEHSLMAPLEIEKIYFIIGSEYKKRFNIDLDLENNEPSIFKSELLKQVTDQDFFHGMVGKSEIMKNVFRRITKVAQSDTTVFIQGPSGTGKELVASAIHCLSNRRNSQLVSINCGAIPEDLLESELFGHKKGSFTGAISDRRGRFELANNGTIFLDEIGDMPLHLQVKLLRVLQNQTIEPLGGDHPIKINTRVIAATHRNLDELMSRGRFREDLFYRLNVIPIFLPALKERSEDIPLLISYFLTKYSGVNKENLLEFDLESLEILTHYEWPGNIRELENLIERLVVLRGGSRISAKDLPTKITNVAVRKIEKKEPFFLPSEGLDLKKFLSSIENSLIGQALCRTSGNKNRASKLLGLNRTTLIEKLKKNCENKLL